MKNIFFLLFLLSILFSRAQDLPAGFAPDEKNLMEDYLQSFQSNSVNARGILTPPPFPNVRAAAEWEEIQTLVITWTSFTSIHREIVRNARLETKVTIICSDSSTVKSYLQSGGVPLGNISYIIAPFNSIWMRDYGANTVYGNYVDSLMLVDWIYNRPRPKDDSLPYSLGRALNIPLYETAQSPYNLIHTGGNYMSDGFGTAFSSKLTDNENPSLTAAQIDTIMKKFMGINRYIRFPVLPYDGIHHIDMHMKLLDEQTLLVGEYPAGVSDGPQIEANLAYITSNFNSVYGTPYKVIRVPQPPDKNNLYPNQNGAYCTYTNAVFVNKTVILPTYYAKYDTTALRIWKESLPGYNIVGIDCDNTAANIIAQSGAIHCITQSVGVSDPLVISHGALPNTCDTSNAYVVNATLMHRSGIAGANVYIRTDTTQPYVAIPMVNVGGTNWTASIPAQPAGAQVFYYIEGTANSGKVINRPMPAPSAYWKFNVGCSTVGISQVKELEVKAIYPNPASAITCIPLVSAKEQKVSVVLKDILGKTVSTIYSGPVSAGDKNVFLFAEQYPAGVYLVEVKSEMSVSNQKLIIR